MADYKEYENVSNDKYERLIKFMNENRFTKENLKNIAKRKLEIEKINKRTYKFTMYIVPEGKSTARFSGKSKRFYIPNIGKFYTKFRKLMKNNSQLSMIFTPCKLKCDFYLPMPKTMHKEEKILAEMGYIVHPLKPDWDNLAKMNDFMNGILLMDDGLIYDGHATKHYSFKPRIEVTVEFMQAYDSKYTEKAIKNSKMYKKEKAKNRKIKIRYLDKDV